MATKAITHHERLVGDLHAGRAGLGPSGDNPPISAAARAVAGCPPYDCSLGSTGAAHGPGATVEIEPVGSGSNRLDVTFEMLPATPAEAPMASNASAATPVRPSRVCRLRTVDVLGMFLSSSMVLAQSAMPGIQAKSPFERRGPREFTSG